MSGDPRPATIRQCAILAGGLASRLGDIAAETPKPVLEVGGRPFVFWLMREMLRFGVEDFVFLTGHLPQAVEHADSVVAVAALPVVVSTAAAVVDSTAVAAVGASRSVNLIRRPIHCTVQSAVDGPSAAKPKRKPKP